MSEIQGARKFRRQEKIAGKNQRKNGRKQKYSGRWGPCKNEKALINREERQEDEGEKAMPDLHTGGRSKTQKQRRENLVRGGRELLREGERGKKKPSKE